MALDYDKILHWPFEEVEQSYSERDSMLYALGLGFGSDPLNAQQLRYVYEEDLLTVPTMPVVLAGPGFWQQNPETGINWKKIVAAEQELTIENPLPPSGTVVSRMAVTDILDKGAEKGAVLYYRRDIHDKATGTRLSTITGTSFLRGDGGFGGSSGPSPKPHPVPDRDPDFIYDFQTLPQQALIYRLSGDYNPLHADPKVAATAGFERPILHGLCTFGIAGHVLLEHLCDYQAQRLKRIGLRFSAPVLPGETIRTEVWREADGQAAFRCKSGERVVANNGYAEFEA